MDEQFIQDAICKPNRIKSVLCDLGSGFHDWNFKEPKGYDPVQNKNSDVINQEFNFSVSNQGKKYSGRMDVVATFNNRRNLVVCEVKKVASPGDIAQLEYYVDSLSLLKSGKAFPSVESWIGLLLAETFIGEKDSWKMPRDCYLVQFRMSGKQPFATNDQIQFSNHDLESQIHKSSDLYLIEDKMKLNWLPHLQRAFTQLTNCRFSDQGIEELDYEWFVCNPKSQHIALHYKGIYFLWVFPYTTKGIHIGYDLPGGEKRERLFELNDSEEVIQEKLAETQIDIRKIVAEINTGTSSFIPPDFSW